jgi:hypothetical protein
MCESVATWNFCASGQLRFFGGSLRLSYFGLVMTRYLLVALKMAHYSRA